MLTINSTRSKRKRRPALEAPQQRLFDEVREAERAILGLAQAQPERGFTMSDLHEETRQRFTPGVITIAFSRLVAAERLVLDERLQGRLA